MTHSTESILTGALSPDGEWIVYPLDKGGNEISHLHLIPTKDGENRKISENPFRTMGIDWKNDGKELARSIIADKGCGIEVFNLENEDNFILVQPTPPLFDLHYSPNGKWIACTSIKSFTDTEIAVFNRQDPSDKIIYNIKKETRDGFPCWSPDGKKLALFSESTGRGRVFIQKFQGDDRIMLDLDEKEDANPYLGGGVWSPDSKRFYYVVGKFGRSIIYEQNVGNKEKSSLPFPEGTVEKPKVSKNGKRIIALHSSMTEPYGIYLYEAGSNSVKPLTSRDFKVNIKEFKKPESIWYETFDERKIHAWYLPTAVKKGQSPAVIHAHGGPWGQINDSWIYGMFDQACSQSGLAILAPNFRGSTGYGAEFQNLDIGDPGGGDLEDVTFGAKWLSNRSDIDGSKIGITGGSYGGYMTLIALTKKPEIFTVGVSRVPVVDWLHMYKLSDPFFQQFESALFGGKPRKEIKQLYIERSPITHVSNIEAPIMIMAGKNDSRCPIEPINNFIKELEKDKKNHEFLLMENAGHISTIFNWNESLPIYSKTIEFLKKYLI